MSKNQLPDLLAELNLDEDAFMRAHDAFNWEYADYDTPSDFVELIKNEVSGCQKSENTNIADKLSDFLNRERLTDKDYIDLHGRIPWHDAINETFDETLREIKIALSVRNQKSFSSEFPM